MVVAVVTGDAAPPKAVLAQVVVVAALTLVAETHERFAVTTLALHRMEHCKGRERAENGEGQLIVCRDKAGRRKCTKKGSRSV